MSSSPLISSVAPFYNEGPGVNHYCRSVIALTERCDSFRFGFVCVDDPSRDDTLALLKEVAATDGRIRVVDLTRNYGKEATLHRPT